MLSSFKNHLAAPRHSEFHGEVPYGCSKQWKKKIQGGENLRNSVVAWLVGAGYILHKTQVYSASVDCAIIDTNLYTFIDASELHGVL